jgi:hypothetical protein
VAAPVSIDGHVLEHPAGDIFEMLAEVPFHVALIDLQEKRNHLRMSTSWFSHDIETKELTSSVVTRSHDHGAPLIRINSRWILRVARRAPRVTHDGFTVSYGEAPAISMEHLALAEKAAEMLRAVLPPPSRDSEAVPPDGSSGGGSGSAELGIPLSWARKARS